MAQTMLTGECVTSGTGFRWPLDIGDPATVVRARALTQGVLTALGMAREAIEDAETMTAELVGNAARHAHPPVELRMSVHEASVVVAVLDASTAMPDFPPRACAADPSVTDDNDPDPPGGDTSAADLDRLISGLAEYGRGLSLVQQLSGGRCGARATATGKTTWFETDRSPAPHE